MCSDNSRQLPVIIFGINDGIEPLLDARKTVPKGISPALEKQRETGRMLAIKTFGAAIKTWLANATLADSTRAMRKHIIDPDIPPVFQNRPLTEIQPEDLRACATRLRMQ